MTDNLPIEEMRTMICSECFNDIRIGDRYKKYWRGRFELYVHAVGCSGVFDDKIYTARMEKFEAELDAIEKQVMNETPEETDAYLRSVGYDPEELGKRMQKKLRALLDESPLNPKNQSPDTPAATEGGE